ncbi:hypothetical protein BRI6_4252 [plant metagenome]|uniref:YcxB-like C-terminal domain-containing protein n=1 Tax=plant metagenome TaxID=1297885 RepID=A0A484S185_9ZZZZ
MQFSYRYERADFVHGCIALMRPPLARRILLQAAWTALVLGLVHWADPGRPRGTALGLLFSGGLNGWIYAAFLGCAVAFWFSTELFGWLICAPIFSRNALARKDVNLVLSQEGLWGGTRDVNVNVSWAAVQRIVETRHMIVFVLSGREGVMLPKRALPGHVTVAELWAEIERLAGRGVKVVRR